MGSFTDVVVVAFFPLSQRVRQRVFFSFSSWPKGKFGGRSLLWWARSGDHLACAVQMRCQIGALFLQRPVAVSDNLQVFTG